LRESKGFDIFLFYLEFCYYSKLYTGNVRIALVPTIASNPLSFSFIAEFDPPHINSGSQAGMISNPRLIVGRKVESSSQQIIRAIFIFLTPPSTVNSQQSTMIPVAPESISHPRPVSCSNLSYAKI
jgi:hypothetical protein